MLALVTDIPSDAYKFLDEERNFRPYKEPVHYFSDYELCIIIDNGTPYPFQFDKEHNAYSSTKPLDWDLDYSNEDEGFIKIIKRHGQQNPTQPPATAPVTVTMKTIKVIVKTLTPETQKNYRCC